MDPATDLKQFLVEMVDGAADVWVYAGDAERLEGLIAKLERKAPGLPFIRIIISNLTINDALWQGICTALASNTTVKVIHVPSIGYAC